LYCFFFSSRRRHTRSYGDWSSDVCSSDLARDVDERGPHAPQVPVDRSAVTEVDDGRAVAALFECGGDVLDAERLDAEERTEAEPIVNRYGSKQQDVHAPWTAASSRLAVDQAHERQADGPRAPVRT